MVEGRVYVMAAGVDVALNGETGDRLWQIDIGVESDEVNASPGVIIGGRDGNLYALGDPS